MKGREGEAQGAKLGGKERHVPNLFAILLSSSPLASLILCYCLSNSVLIDPVLQGVSPFLHQLSRVLPVRHGLPRYEICTWFSNLLGPKIMAGWESGLLVRLTVLFAREVLCLLPRVGR